VRLSQRAAELEDIFQDKIERVESLLEEISQKPAEDIQRRQIVLMDWLRQHRANRKTFLKKLMESFDWTKAKRA